MKKNTLNIGIITVIGLALLFIGFKYWRKSKKIVITKDNLKDYIEDKKLVLPAAVAEVVFDSGLPTLDIASIEVKEAKNNQKITLVSRGAVYFDLSDSIKKYGYLPRKKENRLPEKIVLMYHSGTWFSNK